MKYNWYFPLTDGGQTNGISHAGIETFSGTPLKSLAREICQNSLDAIADKMHPCVVEFSFFEIPTKNIPGYEKIQETIKSIESFWEEANEVKIKTFVENAKKILKEDTIPVARISDFNTSGLTGANKNDLRSKWANLVLSAGSSNKKEGAGGSFGIGKSAPFACSDLHLVFYSSLDEENVSASQGVINLASFAKDSENNQITQGLGYYGQGKNEPMMEIKSYDPNFTRVITGTDIFIFGFKENSSDERDAEIISSIIDSFFYAIWNKTLIVKVNDIIINHESLFGLSSTYKKFLTEYAHEYIPILYQDKSTINVFEEKNFMGLGAILLLLKTEKDYHRKVARIRNNGMKIDNYTSRVNIGKNYSGIFLSEGDAINNFLRHLEGPQHTKWEPARAANPNYARIVISKINIFINDCIRTLLTQEEKEIIEVDIGNLLPDLIPESVFKKESASQIDETITDQVVAVDRHRMKITSRKKSFLGNSTNKKRELDNNQGIENFGNGYVNDGEGYKDPGIKDPSKGSDPGENPVKIVDVEIPILSARVIGNNTKSGVYHISFIPDKSAENVSIELFESTESNNIPAKIIEAKLINGSLLDIQGDNVIKGLCITANQVTRLLIKIDLDDYCAMEMKINGKLI